MVKSVQKTASSIDNDDDEHGHAMFTSVNFLTTVWNENIFNFGNHECVQARTKPTHKTHPKLVFACDSSTTATCLVFSFCKCRESLSGEVPCHGRSSSIGMFSEWFQDCDIRHPLLGQCFARRHVGRHFVCACCAPFFSSTV